MAESYREALEHLVGNADHENKVELYEFAAGALARSAKVSADVALGWLLNAVGEADPVVLLYFARRLPASDEVARRLQRTLLQLTLAFRKGERGSGHWQREFTAFLETGGEVVRSQRVDGLDRSELPADVRERLLDDHGGEVVIQLWPPVTASSRNGG